MYLVFPFKISVKHSKKKCLVIKKVQIFTLVLVLPMPTFQAIQKFQKICEHLIWTV